MRVKRCTCPIEISYSHQPYAWHKVIDKSHILYLITHDINKNYSIPKPIPLYIHMRTSTLLLHHTNLHCSHNTPSPLPLQIEQYYLLLSTFNTNEQGCRNITNPHLVPLVDVKHSQVMVDGDTAFLPHSTNPAKQT